MSDVTVSDALGNIRVVLGNIGTPQKPDYGLQVVGPGGQTTIIDGTSDMFKIIATGTATVAVPNVSGTNDTVVVLTALGSAFTTPPMAAFSMTDDVGSSLNQRGPGFYAQFNSAAPANDYMVTTVRSFVFLTGAPPNTVSVDLQGRATIAGLGSTAAHRYYILVEVGI